MEQDKVRLKETLHISPGISVGNILSTVLLLGSVAFSYGVQSSRVEQVIQRLSNNERAVEETKAQINAQNLAFMNRIEQLRAERSVELGRLDDRLQKAVEQTNVELRRLNERLDRLLEQQKTGLLRK